MKVIPPRDAGTIEIYLTPDPADTRIAIDGKALKGVRAISITLDHEKGVSVEIEGIAHDDSTGLILNTDPLRTFLTITSAPARGFIADIQLYRVNVTEDDVTAAITSGE